MDRPSIEVWRFEVDCPIADRVYLVRECVGSVTKWTEMRRDGGRSWTLTQRLHPGDYRFRYYLAEGATVLHGGDEGLTVYRDDCLIAGTTGRPMSQLARSA